MNTNEYNVLEFCGMIKIKGSENGKCNRRRTEVVLELIRNTVVIGRNVINSELFKCNDRGAEAKR
jgi:hypothetical protein